MLIALKLNAWQTNINELFNCLETIFFNFQMEPLKGVLHAISD